MAKDVIRLDYDPFCLGQTTRLQLLSPIRHRTPDGQVPDGRSLPGALVWTPPEGRFPSNPRACTGRPEIAMPSPLPTDLARSECGRGGPLPLVPPGECIRVYQLGVLGPFGSSCTGWRGYPPVWGVSQDSSMVKILFLPPCPGSTPGPLW